MMRERGFSTFEVMLGVVLFVGLMLLMMKALDNHKQQKRASDAGKQLSVVVDALFSEGMTEATAETGETLIENNTYCQHTSGYLKEQPDGRLESLFDAGVDICNATITVS